MKQYKTTIIAIILIVVAIGGYFLVKNLGVGEPAEPTDDLTGATSYIFPLGENAETKSQIAKLECIAEDHIILEKQSGKWVCTTSPDLDVVANNVEVIISKLYTEGALVYEGAITPEICEDFGFTGERKFSVSMEDGTSYVIVFGGWNTSGSAGYVWLEGTEKILLYAKTFCEGLLFNKADLISRKVFNFTDSGQITSVSVYKDGVKHIQLSAILSGTVGEGRTWEMHYPVSRAGNDTNIESFLSVLQAVSIEDIAASACTDLSLYGLEDAGYSVTLTSPQETISIQIGDKTKDGTGYYFTIGGGNDVYIVVADSINFLDADPLLYMDQVVYLVMYTNLSHVQLTMNQKTHIMSFELDDKNETFYFDGHCVSDPTSDYEKEFKNLLTSFYFLEMTGLELDGAPEVPGEILCQIRYVLADGAVNTVTCTVRDETTMYYYVNDRYIGGYGPRYLLTSDAQNYGIQGCLETLMKCLKMDA